MSLKYIKNLNEWCVSMQYKIVSVYAKLETFNINMILVDACMVLHLHDIISSLHISAQASDSDRPVPHFVFWLSAYIFPWSPWIRRLWQWGPPLQLWSGQKRNEPLLLQPVQAYNTSGESFWKYLYLIICYCGIKICMKWQAKLTMDAGRSRE